MTTRLSVGAVAVVIPRVVFVEVAFSCHPHTPPPRRGLSPLRLMCRRQLTGRRDPPSALNSPCFAPEYFLNCLPRNTVFPCYFSVRERPIKGANFIDLFIFEFCGRTSFATQVGAVE